MNNPVTSFKFTTLPPFLLNGLRTPLSPNDNCPNHPDPTKSIFPASKPPHKPIVTFHFSWPWQCSFRLYPKCLKVKELSLSRCLHFASRLNLQNFTMRVRVAAARQIWARKTEIEARCPKMLSKKTKNLPQIDNQTNYNYFFFLNSLSVVCDSCAVVCADHTSKFSR